jgi:hypothetical protein
MLPSVGRRSGQPTPVNSTMYTELKRNLPNRFLADETMQLPTKATPPTPRKDTGATHDFLLVMPLYDFALDHPSRRDPMDQP